MKTQIGAPAAPDFDHPIEMLAACHGRIEDQIDTLDRLLTHVAAYGCDDRARQAAAGVMRYFDTAGEHHHEDEEVDLFPALEAAAGGAAALTRRLQADHAVMRALWKTLRVQLRAIADGTSAQLDPTLIEAFSRIYRDHIALEERELFPLAERLLDQFAVETLGAHMARRRGVRAGQFERDVGSETDVGCNPFQRCVPR